MGQVPIQFSGTEVLYCKTTMAADGENCCFSMSKSIRSWPNMHMVHSLYTGHDQNKNQQLNYIQMIQLSETPSETSGSHSLAPLLNCSLHSLLPSCLGVSHISCARPPLAQPKPCPGPLLSSLCCYLISGIKANPGLKSLFRHWFVTRVPRSP